MTPQQIEQRFAKFLAKFPQFRPVSEPAEPPAVPVPQSHAPLDRWHAAHVAARQPMTPAIAEATFRDILLRDHPDRAGQFNAYLAEHPIDDPAAWLLDLQNHVNRNLGRREYTAEQSDVAHTFDRAYVINLDRRVDRMLSFLERTSRPDWPHLRPTRFSAIDGRTDKPPHWFTGGDGAWGCRQSHIGALRQALADGLDSVLIFEDDALFPADYPDRLALFMRDLPADWECVWLGNQHLDDYLPLTANVVRPLKPHRGHAYGIRGRQVIEAIANRMEQADQHIDHALGRWLGSQIVTYAPARCLVGQANGQSDIAGSKKSDEWYGDGQPIKPRTYPGHNTVRTVSVAI